MMQWNSWAEFWSMGGRGSFVWGAYGLTLLVFVAEIVAVRLRVRRARVRLRIEAETMEDTRA
jgi:heme exporter protein D